jgi:hypothetical protein
MAKDPRDAQARKERADWLRKQIAAEKASRSGTARPKKSSEAESPLGFVERRVRELDAADPAADEKAT